jgi:[protein-PII] uridylyltransferase
MKTRAVLERGERRPEPGTAESDGRGRASAALATHAVGIPAEEQVRFVEAMPARYYVTMPPDQAPRHLRLFRLGRRRSMAAWIRHRPGLGHSELHLTAFDRPGLLATLTGVLAAHRIDIQHAEVFSTPDEPALGPLAGRALDVFELRGPEDGTVGPARWRAARRDLDRVLGGREELAAVMERRLRASNLPPKPLPRLPVKVVIDNESARSHSVVDVFCADRVGLLHTLARTFFELGLTVDLARITTEGHRAADAFYVRTEQGARLQGEVATEVVEAITAALSRPDQ